MLDHVLGTAYTVLDEVLVGKMPSNSLAGKSSFPQRPSTENRRVELHGHRPLLHYALQQIQQFHNLGEDFAIQHKDSEYFGEVEEELQLAVLDGIPTEKILSRLTPEEILQRLTPEEILQRLTPEEILSHLSPEERLRRLSAEEVVDTLSDEELVHLRNLLSKMSDA